MIDENVARLRAPDTAGRWLLSIFRPALLDLQLGPARHSQWNSMMDMDVGPVLDDGETTEVGKKALGF